MENYSAGAVIMAADIVSLRKWVRATIKNQEPESHGSRWSHRFIAKEISPKLSVCFYVINGYDTHSENVAFENSFFYAEDFMEELIDNDKAPDKFFVLLDHGNEIEKRDFKGFRTLEAGMKYFETNLENIRNTRKTIEEDGEVIWGIGVKMQK